MPTRVPEHDLDEYNGDALLITAAVFLAFSWISVILRVYTRTIVMKSFQLDDWFMFAAQLVFTASCAFILCGVMAGMGRHNKAIEDQQDEVNALMWQALATASYVLDMMLIKLSIGFFLLRLATQKVYVWILRVSLVIVVLWSMVTFLWDIFQCNPVTKQWDYRIEGGKCVTPEQVVQAAYAFSVMCVLSDWLFAILPIPMLWKVKMTKQAKATVIVILGLGIFASVATLIRLKFLADLEDLEDILFGGTDAMVWTLIEPGIAIVAASMATIRPLLRRMRVRGFESSDNPSSYGHNSGWSSSRRSRKGAMPIEEVTLQDLDAKKTKPKGEITVCTTTTMCFSELNKSLPTLPSKNGRSTTAQGVFAPQVHTRSPTWNGTELESPSTHSFEQIHELEAQNQDGGLRLSDKPRK
ncbi:integral membrane family protein [Sarocladium implicatum]|nr:integral membrane family protein [Sarocladium implicatum]